MNLPTWPGRQKRALLSDEHLQPNGAEMEFRLTYSGPLTAYRDDGSERQKARAPEKHRLRQGFHRQLKALWQQHPNLRNLAEYRFNDGMTEVERRAKNWDQFGFKFVPLVVGKNAFLCKVDILMLRPGDVGRVIDNSTGDIDNRLKTLFDALRMPRSREELGGAVPTNDENPFFVLLEDDSQITHVSVETDTMLEPVDGKTNDVRLVISITVRPYHVNLETLDYS